MDINQRKPNHLRDASASTHKHEPIKLPDPYKLVLNWYKTNGKSLAGDELLTDLQIKDLMKILGNPIWNHLYHCWEVELKHMPDLQAYIKHTFEPAKYVYFIEAYNTK